jgi:hypothetical protein
MLEIVFRPCPDIFLDKFDIVVNRSSFRIFPGVGSASPAQQELAYE